VDTGTENVIYQKRNKRKALERLHVSPGDVIDVYIFNRDGTPYLSDPVPFVVKSVDPDKWWCITVEDKNGMEILEKVEIDFGARCYKMYVD
jgi:hypothetical protein